MNVARRAWLGLEAVHAVVYFAPEAADAYRALGLKGFWMGYFASRGAALGPTGPDVVEATFYGFAPAMVRRALPDAWTYTTPEAVLDARRTAAVAALRRLLGDADVGEAAALARTALDGADVGGRPLFAAHRGVPWPDGDAVDDLWHAATLLREHRGDGHVAALVAEGISGVEAHVLQTLVGGIPRETLQPNRGWSDEEWDVAVARLSARDDLADLKVRIEARTDAAAGRPYEGIDAERLCDLLEPMRSRILAADGVPVPNPIGLPGADRHD